MKHSSWSASDVSRETSERLAIYTRLLARWNQTINLIGRNTEADIQTRHFNDSLQLVRFLPIEGREGADLGSGAGFPGLVLSIATGMQFFLVEADQRKAAFLREVISATAAPATVILGRIEAVDIKPVDVITARALAPLTQLLRYSHRLLKPTGVALFLKGARTAAELSEASLEWCMRVRLHNSLTDPTGKVLEIRELTRAAV